MGTIEDTSTDIKGVLEGEEREIQVQKEFLKK